MATLLGQTVMALLIKKYNRNSYIAFTIGFVVAISAVFMTLESECAVSRDKDAYVLFSSPPYLLIEITKTRCSCHRRQLMYMKYFS
eukprot:scaffold593558_cov59-Attheya_sp.AAC.1